MNDGVTCLLSIYKKYADRIFAGDKLFEFRKRRPEWLNTGTRIVLFSADEPKIIIGGFTVAGVWQGTPASLWRRTSSHAGIDRNSYFRYYEGRPVAYAFLISEVWQAKGTLTVFDLCGKDDSFTVLDRKQIEIIKANEPSDERRDNVLKVAKLVRPKIVDVGEKIPGARKDVVKVFIERLNDVTKERLAAKAFSKVFKMFDLSIAVENGSLRVIDAVFCKAVSMRLKTRKPVIGKLDMMRKKSFGCRTLLDDWVDKTYDVLMSLKRFVSLDVKGRDEVLDNLMTNKFINVAADKAEAEKWASARETHEIGTHYTPDPNYVMFEILKRIGYAPGDNIGFSQIRICPSVRLTHYRVYYGDTGRFFISDKDSDKDIDGVIDSIVLRLMQLKEITSEEQAVDCHVQQEEGSLIYHGITPNALLRVFEMNRGRQNARFEVIEKNKCFQNVLKTFKEKGAAFAYRDAIKDQYFKIWRQSQIKRRGVSIKCEGANKRIGKNWRDGRDVNAEDFMNMFGFRGVQFGNWTSQKERQDFVNKAFDALADLSDFVGCDPVMISLNGELGLSFGARGRGDCNAHYEPSEVVINLTKTRGAGSLAHEWWHALDNHLARSLGVRHGMASEECHLFSDVKGVKRVFVEFVKKISASDYAVRSRAVGAYWGDIVELTARFFAVWVDRGLRKKGFTNPYLVRSVYADKLLEFNYEAYLRQMENANITPISFNEFKLTNRAYEGYVYPNDTELQDCDAELHDIMEHTRSGIGCNKSVGATKNRYYQNNF